MEIAITQRRIGQEWSHNPRKLYPTFIHQKSTAFERTVQAVCSLNTVVKVIARHDHSKCHWHCIMMNKNSLKRLK